MSMMENLKFIEEKGIKSFLEQQRKKYTCPKCGGVICVHRKKCAQNVAELSVFIAKNVTLVLNILEAFIK